MKAEYRVIVKHVGGNLRSPFTDRGSFVLFVTRDDLEVPPAYGK